MDLPSPDVISQSLSVDNKLVIHLSARVEFLAEGFVDRSKRPEISYLVIFTSFSVTRALRLWRNNLCRVTRKIYYMCNVLC